MFESTERQHRMAQNLEFGLPPSAFRLPGATHIGQVRLQVSDLNKSLEYYEGLLGLKRLSADANSAVLGAGGRPLVELRSGATTPLSQKHLGLYHFAVLLPDRPSLGSCLTHLLSVGLHSGAADHLVSEALYLQDPDGLGIEIYRDRPRSEWSTRGRELVMATEALDGDAVMEAGAAEAWQGIPSATTIGHVHLHVGSIDEARAFYHMGLGFDVVVWSYPGALFMSAGGYHHHLGTNTWAGAQARAPKHDQPRLLDWELVLPDGESVAAAASNLGTLGYSVSAEEVGGSLATDPWGTAVRLTSTS